MTTAKWCLMRMVSKNPGQQNHHSLAYIRDLQDGEKVQIDQAINMLRSFGSSQWEWNKIDLAYKNLCKAIDAAVESKEKANGHFSENERLILSRTVVETAQVIVSWPYAILDESSVHPGTDDESRQRISALAARLVAEDSILDLLKKIVDAHDDSLVNIASSNGSHVAYLQKSSLDSAGVPVADNWVIIEVFTAALSQIERLAAETLTSYRKSIEDAARIIQGIHGELIYGIPMVIPQENLKKLGTGANLDLTPVEKPDVEGVLRAADSAAKLLEESDDKARRAPRAVPAQPIASNKSTQSDQEGEEAEYAPKTSNLTALLAYAGSLTTQAEIAWSTALDPQRSDSHKEILARWYSFITSLKSHVEDQGRRSDGKGDMIARFPVNAEYFSAEENASDLSNSLSEAGVAVVYAVHNLIESMTGLQQPTVSSVDLNTGEKRTWWDSGSFYETRKAAEGALRVTMRRECLVALAQGETRNSDDGIEAAMQHAILLASIGRECLKQGHYEASILYFSLSVRQLSNQAEIEEQCVDDVVAQVVRLRGDHMEVAARLLIKLAEEVACGKSVNLEKIVVLGNFWAVEIGSLVNAAVDFSRRTPDAGPGEGKV